MNNLDKSTVESVARVFNRILENEADSDHVRTVEDALDRLWVLHGSKIDVDPNNVDANDVTVTFEFFEDFAPTRSEMRSYKANNPDRHPDRVFTYMEDFVDHAERYVNGCLPSTRDWVAEYVCDGDVIEERVYDHDDEIPTDPVIDGMRYECDRTEREDGEVTVYVSEHPVRNDVDIVVNADGDDFINLEAHDGPNVVDGESAVNTLSNEFNWGMLGDTEIIIRDDPSSVIKFIENKGWEWERD